MMCINTACSSRPLHSTRPPKKIRQTIYAPRRWKSTPTFWFLAAAANLAPCHIVFSMDHRVLQSPTPIRVIYVQHSMYLILCPCTSRESLVPPKKHARRSAHARDGSAWRAVARLPHKFSPPTLLAIRILLGRIVFVPTPEPMRTIYVQRSI